jgi:hypothetical protein
MRSASWPGLSRPSTSWCGPSASEVEACRPQPRALYLEAALCTPTWMARTSPAMTESAVFLDQTSYRGFILAPMGQRPRLHPAHIAIANDRPWTSLWFSKIEP